MTLMSTHFYDNTSVHCLRFGFQTEARHFCGGLILLLKNGNNHFDFIVKDGHELTHKRKLVTNIGWFVVHKAKFANRRAAMNLHESDAIHGGLW